MSADGYRPAAGVMLINKARQVWVGQRRDSTLEAWQMPQGGLDPGEDPLEGALRELEEETGIGRDLVEIVARCPRELTYDLPDDLVGKVWKEPWIGQRQTWFLARFLGEDADVNLDTSHAEFRRVEDEVAARTRELNRQYEIVREANDGLRDALSRSERLAHEAAKRTDGSGDVPQHPGFERTRGSRRGSCTTDSRPRRGSPMTVISSRP